MEELKSQFAAYLQHKMPQAAGIEITSATRIHGGASRQTYLLQVDWKEAGQQRQRGMVLRREAASLIDTNSETEFRAYDALFRAGYPVPEAMYLENDTRWLGQPFIVMSEVRDCVSASPFALEPFGEHASKVGEQFFTLLGKLAAMDPAELGLDKIMEKVAPGDAWKRELTYWENVINTDELFPNPIVQAAIRWLWRNPPPPAQKISVVHADFRAGNFLWNAEQGEIKTILDWEMAHLGDPLEDLGWAIDELWAFRQRQRPGGMIAREEALRIWKQVSGLSIDPQALRWWCIFNHVKGIGIWTSAGQEYFKGSNTDPVLVTAYWYPGNVHSRIISEKLVELYDERNA